MGAAVASAPQALAHALHWLTDSGGSGCSEQTSLIVLCGVSFESRKASFLAVLGGETGGGDVYRIPESKADSHPLHLLASAAGSLDRMVVFAKRSRGAACHAVLSKLEESRFIEAYVSAHGSLKLRLPLQALEFELRGGSFHSAEHGGYELAQRQQLSNTLHGFASYLVLSCSAPPTLLR